MRGQASHCAKTATPPNAQTAKWGQASGDRQSLVDSGTLQPCGRGAVATRGQATHCAKTATPLTAQTAKWGQADVRLLSNRQVGTGRPMTARATDSLYASEPGPMRAKTSQQPFTLSTAGWLASVAQVV